MNFIKGNKYIFRKEFNGFSLDQAGLRIGTYCSCEFVRTECYGGGTVWYIFKLSKGETEFRIAGVNCMDYFDE